MADTTGPTDTQKSALKGLVKEALAEYVAENEEKRRTSGEPVDKGDKGDKGEAPKSFFEALFG